MTPLASSTADLQAAIAELEQANTEALHAEEVALTARRRATELRTRVRDALTKINGSVEPLLGDEEDGATPEGGEASPRRTRRARATVAPGGKTRRDVVLSVLDDCQPRTAAEVAKAAGDNYNGVYTTLMSLSENLYVKKIEKDGRKVWAITDRGREQVQRLQGVV